MSDEKRDAAIEVPVDPQTLRDQFNGDWDALEKALPGLIARSVGPLFLKHQREGVRFAIDLLRGQHPPCDRAARVLERFLASEAPPFEIKKG
jgi:hypothetical protein